jgi:hypothetical protein
MKAKVKIEKEVEIRAVLIDIAPRYIGDSDDDDMPSNFPLLNETKSAWVASVNIDTGEIAGWPIGDARKMHVKVCDAGVYSLLDDAGNLVIKHCGYVPHGVVPGSYGDYVELDINENGVITNWPKRPEISEFFGDDD